MDRKIYDSDAVSRDDENPFVPGGGDAGRSRSLRWDNVSHAFVPMALRYRAIDVTVETDRERYPAGDPVAIRVTFRNRVPFPIVLRTPTPVRWRWAVDGHENASAVESHRPDTGPERFTFDRSERKRFERRWDQSIEVVEGTWEPADPGEHTIEAWIDVPATGDHLRDRTTITID